MSSEETRYYLNGVFFHVYGSQNEMSLRAVATDGHRLARVDVSLPDGASGMPGVIIPRKTVSELRMLIDEEDQDMIQMLKAREQDHVNWVNELIA